MSERNHPSIALFAGEKPFPIINTCEHFAGSEKLITRAMELQRKLANVFDIITEHDDANEASAGGIAGIAVRRKRRSGWPPFSLLLATEGVCATLGRLKHRPWALLNTGHLPMALAAGGGPALVLSVASGSPPSGNQRGEITPPGAHVRDRLGKILHSSRQRTDPRYRLDAATKHCVLTAGMIFMGGSIGNALLNGAVLSTVLFAGMSGTLLALAVVIDAPLDRAKLVLKTANTWPDSIAALMRSVRDGIWRR